MKKVKPEKKVRTRKEKFTRTEKKRLSLSLAINPAVRYSL
jgi:hypothetical protein